MKKLISFSVVLLLIVLFFTVNSLAADKNKYTAVSKAAKVEVYYFHFTRRCVTCQAVETETQAAIAALYPVQVKKGLISFKAVNLDEKTSETLAKKCKAEGQALLIISPEKLKAVLKKAIDPLF